MMPRIVFLLAVLAASLTSAAADTPSAVDAEYRVLYGGITIGRIVESFTRSGDTYSARSTTSSEGPLKVFLDDAITLVSAGRVVNGVLQPREFGQSRAKDHKRDLKAVFDWDRNVVRTSMRGEDTETALLPGTQDRLSTMYQFMSLGAYGPTLDLPMTVQRRVETYHYRLVAEEKVATPAGEFETRHYQRVTTKKEDTRVDVWLARERFNFPVRAIFDDPKGFKLEQVIEVLKTR
jgi:uncharacterized protein DUF3108